MRKLSALFILIVVFFPSALAAMTVTSIRPWVLDRGFYERIVDDVRLYDVLLREDVSARFDHELFTSVEQLPAEALSIALRAVVPPDYLRTQSTNVVNQVFDYLEGRTDQFQLAIDVTPIKVALAGDEKTRFATALAAALPACSAGQHPIAPNGTLTRCIAADESIDSAAQQIAAAPPTLIENTPDQVVIESRNYLQPQWVNVNWFLGSGIYALLDLAIVTLITALMGVWLLGAYLGGNDQRGWLKWLSSSLFAPASLIALVGLVLTSSYAIGAIGSNITAAGYSDAYREAATSVIAPVIQQVGSGLFLTGGVACLIALGLLIWSQMIPAGGDQHTKIVQVPVRNL